MLKTLGDESVHCCVTSPPYWGLRDYGVAGQLGLESSPQEYVSRMVMVFREVRRVLRDDGTLWLNLGDSYASDTKGSGGHSEKQLSNAGSRYEMSQRLNHGLKAKDLCGIPWRVAFALQAPDYLGRIRSETDRAWLAALVDGEGCITIFEATSPHGSGSSYPPILQVRMCDPECIQKAMALVGSDSDNPPQYPPSMEGQRPAYQWRIHGRKAADTIAEIYPFLLIKRKQAIVAWNHQTVRDSYETKRGVKIPKDALEKQVACRELIQRLNKREPVDIPSWMVEPPQPFGPGWYLRQDLIWAKPNPMPESVRDRCTKAHEYIFLMAKSERYYYDAEAIAEEAAWERWGDQTVEKPQPGTAKWIGNKSKDELQERTTRNKRSVWEVTTQPFKEAHFATFPPALIEPCIKAGCPEQCCAVCGAPWNRKVERVGMTSREWQAQRGLGNKGSDELMGAQGKSIAGARPPDPQYITIGWSPSCDCKAAITHGTVLDPFAGAGTTGLVADRLQRDAILIELNPEYAAMAQRRINNDAPLFAEVIA